MGEFDDVDPTEFAKGVDQQRDRLRLQQEETARREREEADRRTAELATLYEAAEKRTVELFDLLQKSFAGHKMSDGNDLVVERTGSRPDGKGKRFEEKPPWILIRASSTSLNPRHKRAANFSSPEYVLAARGGIEAKYELFTYPILEQDRAIEFATDDRAEFLKRVQEEIAGR